MTTRQERMARNQKAYRQRKKEAERQLIFDFMASFPGQIHFRPEPAPPGELNPGQQGFVIRLRFAEGVEQRARAWAIDRDVEFDALVDIVTTACADKLSGRAGKYNIVG